MIKSILMAAVVGLVSMSFAAPAFANAEKKCDKAGKECKADDKNPDCKKENCKPAK